MPVFTVGEPDVETFIQLSWDVNAADARWIPPMRGRLRQELAGQDAFGRYGRMQLFGCDAGGRLVGRIAAIINPKLLDVAGHPVGQVGYFEAIDDAAVAGQLFAAAFEWLAAAGAQQVWGPMNGGPHRLHRFMTDGFDRDPFLFEPRNPPYYPRLFEAHGFSPAATWYSCDTSSAQLRHALANQPMLRVRNLTRERYELERADPTNPSAVLPRLHALLDAMWTGHIGYTSLEFAEFAELFAPGLALMTDGDLHFAVERATGRDVGCAFSYPDYTAEVRALDGDASGWGHWLQHGLRPRRLVMSTMGAAGDARRSGLASALLRALLQHCVDEYDEGVMAIIVQELGALQKIAAPTRRYALFARRLA